ncbi:MAG: hypothetical protein E3J72_05250 [Planctomycetota bacterium]|nr:MAG: hypothetical protein E3J72_05250 [Planctomycetota bacterium]
MDEDKGKTALPVAPEEEIIEKKPFHPVETTLAIFCFLILCFAIYLVCDELGAYADATKYKTGEKASDAYQHFKQKDIVHMEDVNKETEDLGLNK